MSANAEAKPVVESPLLVAITSCWTRQCPMPICETLTAAELPATPVIGDGEKLCCASIAILLAEDELKPVLVFAPQLADTTLKVSWQFVVH